MCYSSSSIFGAINVVKGNFVLERIGTNPVSPGTNFLLINKAVVPQFTIAAMVAFQFHLLSVTSILKWEPNGFTSEIVEDEILLQGFGFVLMQRLSFKMHTSSGHNTVALICAHFKNPSHIGPQFGWPVLFCCSSSWVSIVKLVVFISADSTASSPDSSNCSLLLLLRSVLVTAAF